MRLDFNILWVEDQPNNVSDQQERIETQIRREGFRLQVQFASSVDEATGYLSEHIYGDHIDLILMDYDLGAGKSGDEGLKEVREIFPYKDLIFYSASNTANLTEMVKERSIQGVFTAYRPELPDVVDGVFENLVRKVLDIDHSRGIVMGATSDIDGVIFDALIKLFDGCSNEQKKFTIEAVHKRLDEKFVEFNKIIEKAKAIKHLSDLENQHIVYTSDDKLRLLQKIMDVLSLHAEEKEHFNSYRSNVMPKRNDLAHILVNRDGFSRKFYDRKGVEVRDEDMRALRVMLLDFQEVLDRLFPN